MLKLRQKKIFKKHDYFDRFFYIAASIEQEIRGGKILQSIWSDQREPELHITQIENKELVDRARSGDREAFGELVRRHRTKALGWANSMTQDVYLAEDIVQDALIRAFLHLGTLVDGTRFTPWLKKIVYNQANMKLRRGGLYGKEMPFTSFKESSIAYDEVDWTDIEHILFHLSKSSSDCYQTPDASARLMRKELFATIREVIKVLNKREREIFEAYFFQQLPPQEIASLFQTTTSNVYNILSRSRAKVQKERIRIYINHYVKERRELGLPKKRILTKPIDFIYGG